MNRQTYLPLILATTLASATASAWTVSDAQDPTAGLGDKDRMDVPDFAGKPDDVPPDYGRPDKTPPDFAGKPDDVPDYGRPDKYPPDFAGKPDDVPDYGRPDKNPPDVAGVIPVPAAAWLLGSGLIGLVGAARRRTQNR